MANKRAAPTAISSALFSAYRTVGLVCDGAQMALQSLGKDTFFATSIGNAFQVFNTEHLTLALVSRVIPFAIRCVTHAHSVLLFLVGR